MPSERLSPHREALLALGGQRVWSLLISVFGDLAQARDAGIDGPVLSAIMESMGIRAEAIRVALHRLRNDGWIESQKSGRTSRHSLSDLGRRESAAASPRIYGGSAELSGEWQMVICETAASDAMQKAGFAMLMPRVFVGAAELPAEPGALVLKGSETPDWLKDQLVSESLREDYARLRGILAGAERDLPEGTQLCPLDVAVLRCLIVHNWRRIVLKHPELPKSLLPTDWPGSDCRHLVTTLLERFPRPELSAIVSS